MIKRFFDEGKVSSTDPVLLTGEQFETQTFLRIVDQLLQEVKRRIKAYQIFSDSVVRHEIFSRRSSAKLSLSPAALSL